MKSLEQFRNMVLNHDIFILIEGRQAKIVNVDLDLYSRRGDLVISYQDMIVNEDGIKTEDYEETVPFIRDCLFCEDYYIVESDPVFYKQFSIKTRNKMKILDMRDIAVVHDLSSKSPEEIMNVYKMIREEILLYTFFNPSVFHKNPYPSLEYKMPNEKVFEKSDESVRNLDGLIDSARSIHWFLNF